MIQKILSNTYKKAEKISIDRNSKLIFFSDCHRGDNSYADDFSHNRHVYFHALRNYYDNGFTYFELGDGDELWENRNFGLIFKAHKNVYGLLKKFHDEKRLHMIFGNHDMIYSRPKIVEQILGSYFDMITGTRKELLKNLKFHESIILEIEGMKKNILLIHGHQADFFNYVLWRFSRFLVRFLWQPMQKLFGVKDPTSPAKNYKELIKVERRIKKWIENNNNQMVIAGHTHRPRFPEPNELPYFNDGSCVHPRAITGIEIENLEICLIKWHTISHDDGTMQIVRTVLEGPEKLSSYLK
ncbi:metallophosphoesterase family protein [Urechidicola croceus]|uniref:Serine/threonine protein phosphatase n=1 Tax=Urechidicola croceus TaxID=1850246 RepID=A0A1D8P8J8_9FLAO|nr:metallophosphoesterase family protein [Urechidicola croceus]AOW20895.1 serine/threonine protein phosphatase [Urechidicola croceus]